MVYHQIRQPYRKLVGDLADFYAHMVIKWDLKVSQGNSVMVWFMWPIFLHNIKNIYAYNVCLRNQTSVVYIGNIFKQYLFYYIILQLKNLYLYKFATYLCKSARLILCTGQKSLYKI